MSETNRILLTGTAAAPAIYSHTVLGEAFYSLPLSVLRTSGTEDLLNVTVSERLLGDLPVEEGLRFTAAGQIRSYTRHTERGNRLAVTVFAREFIPVGEDEPDGNDAELTGTVLHPVVRRVTPLEREIADVMLGVRRHYGKSDHIPAIVWGRNARFLADTPAGTLLHVRGRLQSREYRKLHEDGTVETRTVYEVSCMTVEPV